MLLEDLAGQDRATALLLRAVSSQRVPHTYLFDGPRGVGKRTAGIGLGLALACPQAPGTGCGRCDACRRIVAGNHPDVRLVSPATTQIVVDQAQEIVALASRRAHEAPVRVIIIDDADRLNESAGNCLLKTLEEPFPATHLILVTAAPDRLLPTIRSRAQRVRFVPVRSAALVTLAMARGADRSLAEAAAALAGGSVARLYERLEDDTENSPWNAVAELRRAACQTTMAPIFDAAAAFGEKAMKEALPDVFVLLARFYRDALAETCGASDLVLLQEQRKSIDALATAARRDPAKISLRRALSAVAEAQVALAANVNAVTTIERLLLEIRPCEQAAA